MPRFLILILAIFSLSCNREKVPAYISIETIKLETTPEQGSSSSRIIDAWIYIDDNPLGVFELPCRVPALHEGKHKIVVLPGIKVNGIASLRSAYPFYSGYEIEAELIPGQTLHLEPVVHLNPEAKYAHYDDFENLAGASFEPTAASDTSVTLTNDPNKVFEGLRSLYATLKRDSGRVQFQLLDPINLPKGGNYVFLEMDYKINTTLTVGTRAFYTFSNAIYTEVLNLRPTTEWNKVYINLTREISQEVNAANYKVIFTADKAPSSPPVEILIDNLKIIHF